MFFLHAERHVVSSCGNLNVVPCNVFSFSQRLRCRRWRLAPLHLHWWLQENDDIPETSTHPLFPGIWLRPWAVLWSLSSFWVPGPKVSEIQTSFYFHLESSYLKSWPNMINHVKSCDNHAKTLTSVRIREHPQKSSYLKPWPNMINHATIMQRH